MPDSRRSSHATFALRASVALHAWQVDARDAWIAGDARGPYRGTLAVYTGGGKTRIALACAAAAAAIAGPTFKLVVVTPTIALADQWATVLGEATNQTARDILRLDASDDPVRAIANHRVVIAVINTASRAVAFFGSGEATMLVVDESHRAGAPSFRTALTIPARFRLGLSATPERDDVDDEGEPLVFAEQATARELGDVVYRFGLAEARLAGYLPDYRIVHHALALTAAERAEYDEQSRTVDGIADRLRTHGIAPGRARGAQARAGEAGATARAYLAAVSKRKDLLFRASERNRIALHLIAEAVPNPANRLLIFNERIAEAEALYDAVHARIGERVVLEHSQRSPRERKAALASFRDGTAQALVSAKSLIEGIDVPDASIGISVASTGSVRQRIQSIGRVLRKSENKRAEMHLLFVADTVDDAIYAKEDWSDLTGEAANTYLRWPLASTYPETLAGPPQRPRATEAQEAERLASAVFPTAWHGTLDGTEYSVDTKGSVTNAKGIAIANPQDVAALVERTRGAKGGRFRITPTHRFIVTATYADGERTWNAAGRLAEPFVTVTPDAALETANAGDAERIGPLDSANGNFRIRARAGGIIERRGTAGTPQVARTTGAANDPRIANAHALLAAWRTGVGHAMKFAVNGADVAWYRDAGIPRFLAHVPSGFVWEDEGQSP